MHYGHRVGTHYVRTDPPVVSIDSNFIWSDVVRVILVRQFVHFTTHFFTATQFNHILAELLITDEPVVNTQEMSLLAFLLERIRDEVLVIPWLLPVTVPVGSPFLDVVIGNREEIESVLDELLVLLRSRLQEVPRTCSRQCRRPSTTGIFCTVLWVAHRVVRINRCSQLHESCLLILC